MTDQRLILKRGTEADGIKNSGTVKNGEIWFSVDSKKLFVGWDGESFEVAQVVEAKDGKLFADVPAKPFYLPLAVKPQAHIDTCRYCGVEGTFPNVCANSRDMEDFAINDKGGVRGERCYAALVKQGGGEKGLRYVDLNRNPPPPTEEVKQEDIPKEQATGRLPAQRTDPPIKKWWEDTPKQAETSQQKEDQDGNESKSSETGSTEGSSEVKKSGSTSKDNISDRKSKK